MNDIYTFWVGSLALGIGLGVILGFIAWAIGFVIYSIIKMFKMA